MTRDPFCDFLAELVGTRRWCVAASLTDRLRAKGYEVAISQARYKELTLEWEQANYGAPLAGITEHGPALFKAAKDVLRCASLPAHLAAPLRDAIRQIEGGVR
jgi:hypothetical protein